MVESGALVVCHRLPFLVIPLAVAGFLARAGSAKEQTLNRRQIPRAHIAAWAQRKRSTQTLRFFVSKAYSFAGVLSVDAGFDIGTEILSGCRDLELQLYMVGTFAYKHGAAIRPAYGVVDHVVFVVEVNGAKLPDAIVINNHEVVMPVSGFAVFWRIFGEVLANQNFSLQIGIESKRPGDVGAVAAARLISDPLADEELQL
jgi:hypothetical protein